MDWWDHQDRCLREALARLGEWVVVFFPGGDPSGTVVRCRFDVPAAHAGLGLVLELSNQAPYACWRVADLPNAEMPEQGWQFEARGALWEIVDVEPDGGGAVKCRCFRVGPGSVAPLPPLTPEPIEDDDEQPVDVGSYA